MWRGRHGLVESLPLALPGLAIYSVLVVVPVLVSIAFSLTNWTGIGLNFKFVGASNYSLATTDDRFQHAALVSLQIAVASTFFLNIFGIPLAVLLNRSGRILRLPFLLPIVLSPIVVGIAWREILGQDGAINRLLVGAGGDTVPFLSDSSLALASYIFVTVWQVLGYNMLIYLAALQTIPRELEDAAKVDGASGFGLFRHITVPLLAPAILLNCLFNVVYGMREYDRVVAMTSGGPAGATETIPFYVLGQAFGGARYGYASALTVFMVLVVLAATLIIIRTAGSREAAAT